MKAMSIPSVVVAVILSLPENQGKVSLIEVEVVFQGRVEKAGKVMKMRVVEAGSVKTAGKMEA